MGLVVGKQRLEPVVQQVDHCDDHGYSEGVVGKCVLDAADAAGEDAHWRGLEQARHLGESASGGAARHSREIRCE